MIGVKTAYNRWFIIIKWLWILICPAIFLVRNMSFYLNALLYDSILIKCVSFWSYTDLWRFNEWQRTATHIRYGRTCLETWRTESQCSQWLHSPCIKFIRRFSSKKSRSSRPLSRRPLGYHCVSKIVSSPICCSLRTDTRKETKAIITYGRLATNKCRNKRIRIRLRY